MLLLANNIALASRQLEKDEILEIIKTLTDQSISTWIPYGTIKGTHFEYSASDDVAIDSTEQVKYDGNRFFWEIDISLDKTSKNIEKDLKKNAKRLFVWDGDRYTMYFASTNNAIVSEGSGQMPVNVNGLLTAGIIPWGFGAYSYKNLSTAELSAMENYKEQIVLTVKTNNEFEIEFLLDPSQNYVVLTYCLNNDQGDAIIKKDYSDFKLAGDIQIPTNIIIERYDTTKSPSELVSRDEWDITSVNLNPPKQSEFVVPYRKNAFIEFHPSSAGSPLSYHFSDTIDTEVLLQKRLEIASTNSLSENCATIAIEHVFSQFGKEITSQQLAQLVGADNSTNLYDMRQLTLDSGLNSAAIVTDLKTLRQLNDCQIILYLQESKHYVVLENIDSKYAWLIDLDNDKFYYRTSLDKLKYLWSNAIALLISSQSLESVTEIGDDNLKDTKGSTSGGIPNYSCTDVIQSYRYSLCPPAVGDLCGGRYWQWADRYGCIKDDEGGECTGSDMVGKIYSICTEDDYTPGSCTITGNWISRYIRACK